MLAALSMPWMIAVGTAVAAVVLALLRGGQPKREVLTPAARRWFGEYTRAKVGRGDLSPLSASVLYRMYTIETGESPFEGDVDHRQLHEFLARQPYQEGEWQDADAWRRG